MSIEEKEISYDTGYVRGYDIGYTWMSRGENFLHPKATRGYIPGGPHNYHCRYLDAHGKPTNYGFTKTMNPAYVAQQDYIKGWRKGFIDGINQYVKEHELPYDPLEYV